MAKSHNRAFAVLALIVMFVVASSAFHERTEENLADSTDIVGDWYLVSSTSYDENANIVTTPNKNSNIHVEDTVMEGNVFYGMIETDITFKNGTEFCGIRTGNTVFYDYQTSDSVTSCVGKINNQGHLEMVEMHYYSDVVVPFWYISINIYSKNPTASLHTEIDTPNINPIWKLWSGSSSTYGYEYKLSGPNFLIYNQYGKFFEGEMDQIVGSEIKQKSFIGMLACQEMTEYGNVWIAYIIDETGMIWHANIGDDVLIMRSTSISEIDVIAGKPVGIERIYRNPNIEGAPGPYSNAEGILGEWSFDNNYTTVMGDGTVTQLPEYKGYLLYDNAYDAVYAATGGIPGLTHVTESTYGIVNGNMPNGYLYFSIGTYEGDIQSGYQWLSEDEDSLYKVIFTYDGYKNGAIVIEFERQ